MDSLKMILADALRVAIEDEKIIRAQRTAIYFLCAVIAVLLLLLFV